MFKARFKHWGVTKYNVEATMAALLLHIQRRKRHGKRSRILKTGLPFSKGKIASHIKKKDMTEGELLEKAAPEAPIPTGFTFTTPPPDDQETPTCFDDSPSTTVEGGPPVWTPPSSGKVTDSDGCDKKQVRTPQSTPETERSRPQTSSVRPSSAGISVIVDSQKEFLPDLSHNAFSNSWDDFPGAQISPGSADIGEEAFRLSAPDSFLSSDPLNTNFHGMLAYCSRHSNYYHSEHQNSQGNQAERSSYIEVTANPQPEAYVALCFLSCMLHGQGRDEAANLVTSRASQLYRALVQQKHEQALSCLNHVLTLLFLHGKNEFAIEFLKNARLAALCSFDDENPIVVTIRFMISQASSTAKECGISLARLRWVYDGFKEDRTLKHPYTLIAGYHLAWRLAMDDDDDNGRFEAHQLLCTLQDAAEEVFGKSHMQSIAILTTMARILHDLGHLVEAEKTMSEAMTRIEVTYHSKHPFSLEAKRRHAVLLRDIGEVHSAEKKWIEVALGRVEVLGPDHSFSKASVQDVNRFLNARGREEELRAFQAALAPVTAKSNSQTSTIDF